MLVVFAFSSYRKNNKCQRCISFTKQAFRLQIKHLTDKSGISFTNIQFSIYKVAVWLTNLHLGLLLSQLSVFLGQKSNYSNIYSKMTFEKSKIVFENM